MQLCQSSNRTSDILWDAGIVQDFSLMMESSLSSHCFVWYFLETAIPWECFG